LRSGGGEDHFLCLWLIARIGTATLALAWERYADRYRKHDERNWRGRDEPLWEASRCGEATMPPGARVSGQRVEGMKRLSGAHGNREQKPSPPYWRRGLL
jgi:hypothetical protein